MQGKTEEDTFRTLAKPVIDKMVVIYQTEKKKYYRSCSLDNIAICKKYGWRWEEFLRAKKDAGYPPT
jgi:hypothetical protein